MVDGGTRFHAVFADGWPALAPMLEHLRRPDTPDAGLVSLPTPDGAPCHARVIVGGVGRHVVTFHAIDRAWWRINLRTGETHAQLKAKSLWAEGYAATADLWLRRWTFHATGRSLPDFDLGHAFRHGWRMTGLELCADFEGLGFYREDAPHFLGARRNGDEGESLTVWGGEGSEHGDAGGGWEPFRPRVETINVGRRSTSPLSLCIYDKARQIDAVKGGDASTYRAIWTDHGWEGAPVCRVELRFSGRALAVENTLTGELLDFRDPRTAADLESVDRLWRVATHKRRLVIAGTADRRDRCDVDPRWRVVMAVGAEAPGKWRQLREVQKGTHAERVRRSARDASRGLARFAALHGHELEDWHTATRALAYAFHCHRGDGEDLGQYGRDYLSEQRDVIGPEIDEARRIFEVVLWDDAGTLAKRGPVR